MGSSYNSTNQTLGARTAQQGVFFVSSAKVKLFQLAIGFLGIIGNGISICIFSRPEMVSSVNFLLTSVACCDNVIIIISTCIPLYQDTSKYSNSGLLSTYQFKVFPILNLVLCPLSLISQMVSVYLTLLVTLERYVAVCHPLQARSLCTYGRAKRSVMLVVSISTLYNLPHFFDLVLTEIHIDDSNSTFFVNSPSSLRFNHYYDYFYNTWAYMTFIYFIPFSCFLVLNGVIYRQLRRSRQPGEAPSRTQQREGRVTAMLLCVVVEYMLCNVVPLVSFVLQAFYGTLVEEMVWLTNLTFVLNSSENFLIYFLFSKKFRRVFLKTFINNSSPSTPSKISQSSKSRKCICYSDSFVKAVAHPVQTALFFDGFNNITTQIV